MTADSVRRPFPFPVKPDTWPLDETFSRIHDRYEDLWLEKGYCFKWAIEINFNMLVYEDSLVRGSSDAEKRKTAHLRRFDKDDTNGMHLVDRLADGAAIKSFRAEIYQKLRKAVLEDLPQTFFESIEQSRADVLSEIEGFHEALQDPSQKERYEHAAQSLYLAHLHLLPALDGGIYDQIEGRFGDYESGIGWFDEGREDCEVRVIPSAAPDFIDRYHLVLGNMANTAIKHGISCLFQYTHFHFSVTDLATGLNIMPSEDPRHLTLKARMVQSIGYFMSMHPALVMEFDVDSSGIYHQFHSATDRTRSLRQKEKSWELRVANGCSSIHAMRDIAFIMMAGYVDEARYDIIKEAVSLAVARKPVIEADGLTFGRRGMLSTLEHCRIDYDGHLEVDENVIEWNIPLLLEECGLIPEDAQVRIKDQSYDLSQAEGWVEFVKTISADLKTGRFILPEGAPEEIRHALKDLKIARTRTTFDAGGYITSAAYDIFPRLSYLLGSGPYFKTIFKPDELEALQAHYGQYYLQAAFRQAASMIYLVGDHVQKDGYDDESRLLVYDHLWHTSVYPSAVTYFLDAINLYPLFHENGVPVSLKRMQDRQSLFKNLRAHFNQAVDEEIAYRRAQGEASNSVIDALEDVRGVISNFSSNPEPILNAVFIRDIRNLMKTEEEDDAFVARDTLTQHRDWMVSVFLVMMHDPDVPVNEFGLHAHNLQRWVREAMRFCEAENPIAADNAVYRERIADYIRENIAASIDIGRMVAHMDRNGDARVSYDVSKRLQARLG